jgi:sugar-specific transcriptional regulator TrmB
LGLTRWQAKVYFALVQSGIATVKTISNVSEIPRQHIYHILSTLQELGLVEKAVTAPIMFKAIPIKAGLSMLMERRIKETSELQTKTRDLLKNFGENNAKTIPHEEEPQFVLIPENKPLLLRLKKATENAQTSVDFITTWEEFRRSMFNAAKDFKKGIERGAKFRSIMDKPQDKKLLQKIMEDFKKNSSFQVRCIFTPPPTVLAMFDKKEVIISTSATSPTVTPALWSNNPSLLAILQDYFEIMWNEALEDKHEEH